MAKHVFRLGVTCVSLALAFVPAPRTHAAVVALWQTTFNCNDWTQSMGLGDADLCLPGDGLAGAGAWTSNGHPNGDEVNASANYPGGLGGKGFRHWRCDGTNCNGGGIRVVLPSSYTELWVRWYMRYQSGFAFSPLNYTKDLYFNVGGASAFTLGFHSSDTFGVATNSPSRNIVGAPGWTSVNRLPVGDGAWHCYEAHVRMDTNGGNGLAEAWVDNVRSVSASNVSFGTSAGWDSFLMGSNQASPANGGDRYTDYDDVVVSNTGRIGCIGSAPAPAVPAAPTNLRIVR